MKVDGINPAEMAAQFFYLDKKGLGVYFTPTAVDNNSGERYMDEEHGYNWSSLDLPSMLNKLQISQNKFFIIRLLKRGDIMDLLYYLDKDKLLEAFKFFPRSKLIQFIYHLPKEIILKMLLWVIPLRVFLQFFSTEVILNILRSKRLDVSSFVRGFENMPKEFLQKLMSEITGQGHDKQSHKELLAMFRQLDKNQIMEGMKKMSSKDIFEFVFQEVRKDPELLMMIPRGELMKVVSLMPKPNLIDLFRLLPENMLVQFLSQLPEQFLAMAAAQIDDATFGSILMNQYPDLIAELASAA